MQGLRARRLAAAACAAVLVLLAARWAARWLDEWHLVQAAGRNDIAAVRVYLHRGAGVNARAANGSSALMAAAYGGHTGMVQLLLDSGADPGDGLYPAILMRRSDIVGLLIARGVDLRHARAGYRWTPLQAARAWGQKDIAEMLLRAGAK